MTTLESRARAVVEDAGALVMLGLRTVAIAFRHPRALWDLVPQIESLGTRSLGIALLTALFSSLVMTVQFSVQLARFGAKEYVGNVVSVSLVRELGPVLTALMVGGRIGAGITAEIGSMAVSEQLDAMRSMCADPVEKLVFPRVLAAALVLPLLTVLADVVGMAGAMVMAAFDTRIDIVYFYNSLTSSVEISDVVGGLVKTVFFGAMIALIACHRGLMTRDGTAGVGSATTRTVVTTSIVTIMSDFVLTKGLLAFGL